MRKIKTFKRIINEFLKAVYPEYTDLQISASTEESTLEQATLIIKAARNLVETKSPMAKSDEDDRYGHCIFCEGINEEEPHDMECPWYVLQRALNLDELY